MRKISSYIIPFVRPNSPPISYKYPYNSKRHMSSIKSNYQTLKISQIISSTCVVVQFPTLEAFQINTNYPYNHEIDDVSQDEVLYASDKELCSKSRMNTFLGGRIALRYVRMHVHVCM